MNNEMRGRMKVMFATRVLGQQNYTSIDSINISTEDKSDSKYLYIYKHW